MHTGSLYKGGANLFEYVADCDRNRIEFVQVGGTQNELEHWSCYYQKRGYDNIRFVAHQPPDRIKLYQHCADLLFYVTHKNSRDYWCTSPLKIFEYMAAGTPILAACIGSICEVLNDSNAFCYDPEKKETISAMIQLFLDDPAAKKTKSERALHEVKHYYSWQVRVQKIFSFVSDW